MAVRRNGHARTRAHQPDLTESAGHVVDSLKELGGEAQALAGKQTKKLPRSQLTALHLRCRNATMPLLWTSGRIANAQPFLRPRLRSRPPRSSSRTTNLYLSPCWRAPRVSLLETLAVCSWHSPGRLLPTSLARYWSQADKRLALPGHDDDSGSCS